MILFVILFLIQESLAVPCVLNLDLRTTGDLPMIINRNNDFIYPSPGSRILTFSNKEKLALFCHGIDKSPSAVDQTVVTALPSSMSYVPLTCSNGVFLYDGNKKPVDVLNAVCTASHQPEMSKTFEPCSPFGGDGRTSDLSQLFTAQIAWNISGKWKEQIQVCADDKTYTSLWVKYTIHGASIVQRDLTPGRPVFRIDTSNNKRFFGKSTTTGVTNAYTKSSQVDMMIKLLNTNNTLYGTNGTIIDTTGGSNYFARGHMAPDADFIYDVEQDATYYFMNVVPQFQSFNNGNWKSLEIAFRKYADSKSKDMTAYTGTLGNLAYPDKNGVQTPIYLLQITGVNYIAAPKFMWKLLHNPDLNEAVLFIGLNNPYASNTNELNFCTNVCSQISWVLADFTNTSKGAFICCQVDAKLKETIPNIPNLADANNNWPNLMKSP